MPRIRTVKPEMAQDEDIATCTIEAQLLAVRILNHADDEGYFKAHPALIKSACFPLLDSVNIHGVLSELSSIGYLVLFEGSDGKQYGHVTNFTAHQKINRPSPSKIKGFRTFTEDSVSPHEQLTPGKEQGTGKGKEQGKEIPIRQEPAPPDPVPVQKIVDAYHESLPTLPRVAKLTTTRRGYIQQRWREGDLPDLETWGKFFGYVGESDFLMGRAQGTNGKPPFRADLEWLTKPANYAKIAEGKYHREL